MRLIQRLLGVLNYQPLISLSNQHVNACSRRVSLYICLCFLFRVEHVVYLNRRLVFGSICICRVHVFVNGLSVLVLESLPSVIEVSGRSNYFRFIVLRVSTVFSRTIYQEMISECLEGTCELIYLIFWNTGLCRPVLCFTCNLIQESQHTQSLEGAPVISLEISYTQNCELWTRLGYLRVWIQSLLYLYEVFLGHFLQQVLILYYEIREL